MNPCMSCFVAHPHQRKRSRTVWMLQHSPMTVTPVSCITFCYFPPTAFHFCVIVFFVCSLLSCHCFWVEFGMGHQSFGTTSTQMGNRSDKGEGGREGELHSSHGTWCRSTKLLPVSCRNASTHLSGNSSFSQSLLFNLKKKLFKKLSAVVLYFSSWKFALI